MKIGKWFKKTIATGALIASLMAAPKPIKAEPVTNNQTNATLEDKLSFTRHDAAALGINMGLSCAYAGIKTAVRTKDLKQSLEACGQGMFGGAIIYAGQKMGAYSGAYPGLGWAGQLVNSTGVSIRDNAADGLRPFDRFQYDLGPVRLSIGKSEHNNGRIFNAYILPYSAGSLLKGFISKNDKFDWKRSLQNGVFIFNSKKMHRDDVGGVASGNIVFMKNDLTPITYKSVLGHEIIHTMQYREASSFSNLLDTIPAIKIKNKKVQPFRFLKNRLHLDIGNDFGWGTMFLPFSRISHDKQPIEYIPVNLQLNINYD